jgi:S1-C subfamily serine protease
MVPLDMNRSSPHAALQHSVVRIFTVTREPNPFQPWTLKYQENSGGSGCIVHGHRILTNAHVVTNCAYIQVVKVQDPRRYTVDIEYIDHGSELALLRVADPTFFEGTVPVTLGDLPIRQESVTAYGFPIGGEELATTTGVVSRIEVRRYSHSARRLLALQTDAALGAGNSGGPVFSGEKMVGLVFQSKSERNRIGYIIPTPIIGRFFKDIEDGEVSGIPDLGIYWQKIESDTLRHWLGLSPAQTGILVSRVLFESSSWEALNDGDVILAVNDAQIAGDGTITLRNHERVEFSHLVSLCQVGDELVFDVMRSGSTLEIPIKLKKIVSMVPPPLYRGKPRYLIYAGLVFMPLTQEYLRFLDWENVSSRFRYFFYGAELPSPRRKEVIFINQVLAHDINVGYHGLRGAVVERINGVDISELRDVARALQSPNGQYHVIEIDHHGIPGEYTEFSGTRIVLDANRAEAATQEILTNNEIPRAASEIL